MVKSKDSECISSFHPCPGCSSIIHYEKHWNSVFTSIGNSVFMVQLFEKHFAQGNRHSDLIILLWVCSHGWYLSAYRYRGYSWDYYGETGKLRAGLLIVPISLCCGGEASFYLTSAWPPVFSQGHLGLVDLRPELTLCFSRSQLPFWITARPLLSLVLQCFSGIWLWLWHHRSCHSSLHGTFSFCLWPLLHHIPSRIPGGLCAQLSAGGITGFLPGCRGPMAGWISHVQTLILQDQLCSGEHPYDCFPLGAIMGGLGTVPVFIPYFPLSLHSSFSPGQKWSNDLPPSPRTYYMVLFAGLPTVKLQLLLSVAPDRKGHCWGIREVCLTILGSGLS